MKLILQFVLLTILFSCTDEVIFIQPKVEMINIEEEDPIPDFNCSAENFGTEIDDGYFFPLNTGNIWSYNNTNNGTSGNYNIILEGYYTSEFTPPGYGQNKDQTLYEIDKNYYVNLNDIGLDFSFFGYVNSDFPVKVFSHPIKLNECWEVTDNIYNDDFGAPDYSYFYKFRIVERLETFGDYEDVIVMILSVEEQNGFFSTIYRKAYWAKNIGLVLLEELDENFQEKRILLRLNTYSIN